MNPRSCHDKLQAVGITLYFAAGLLGSEMRVVDVSNPTNCLYVERWNTKGFTRTIEAINGRIYVANGNAGLYAMPSLPGIQLNLHIDAAPNLPFTLEAATNLSDPNPWQPLLTTNVATMPFDFVDFDVKLTNKPQKFYRVRQP